MRADTDHTTKNQYENAEELESPNEMPIRARHAGKQVSRAKLAVAFSQFAVRAGSETARFPFRIS